MEAILGHYTETIFSLLTEGHPPKNSGKNTLLEEVFFSLPLLPPFTLGPDSFEKCSFQTHTVLFCEEFWQMHFSHSDGQCSFSYVLLCLITFSSPDQTPSSPVLSPQGLPGWLMSECVLSHCWDKGDTVCYEAGHKHKQGNLIKKTNNKRVPMSHCSVNEDQNFADGAKTGLTHQ